MIGMTLDAIAFKHPHGGSKVLFVIIALLVIVVGVVQTVRPGVGWRTSPWQFRSPNARRPSRAGVIAARAGGVIIAAFGVVILVMVLAH